MKISIGEMMFKILDFIFKEPSKQVITKITEK